MEQYGLHSDRNIREILKWQYLDKAREGDRHQRIAWAAATGKMAQHKTCSARVT